MFAPTLEKKNETTFPDNGMVSSVFFKVLEKSVKKIRPPSAVEKGEKKCEKFPRKYEKSPKKYKKHLKSTEKYEKKCENAKSAPSARKSVKIFGAFGAKKCEITLF